MYHLQKINSHIIIFSKNHYLQKIINLTQGGTVEGTRQGELRSLNHPKSSGLMAGENASNEFTKLQLLQIFVTSFTYWWKRLHLWSSGVVFWHMSFYILFELQKGFSFSFVHNNARETQFLLLYNQLVMSSDLQQKHVTFGTYLMFLLLLVSQF